MIEVEGLVSGWPVLEVDLDESVYDDLRSRTLKMVSDVLIECNRLAELSRKDTIDLDVVNTYIDFYGLQAVSSFPHETPRWMSEFGYVLFRVEDEYSDLRDLLHGEEMPLWAPSPFFPAETVKEEALQRQTRELSKEAAERISGLVNRALFELLATSLIRIWEALNKTARSLREYLEPWPDVVRSLFERFKIRITKKTVKGTCRLLPYPLNKWLD